MTSLDAVARVALQAFDALPKTGKPNKASEWTVLAAIVQHDGNTGGEFKVQTGRISQRFHATFS
jgi:secreted protein with Ig-like and vWFA domain